MRNPFVGKENASSAKVKEITHGASRRDISKRLATVRKHRIVNDSHSAKALIMRGKSATSPVHNVPLCQSFLGSYRADDS